MNSRLKHTIEYAQNWLIEQSAPTLKREYTPQSLRPPVKPVKPAYITLGELMTLKGVTI